MIQGYCQIELDLRQIDPEGSGAVDITGKLKEEIISAMTLDKPCIAKLTLRNGTILTGFVDKVVDTEGKTQAQTITFQKEAGGITFLLIYRLTNGVLFLSITDN